MTSFKPLRRAGRRTGDVLLWCGAGLGTLSILAALTAVIFGIVPLVFISGSMSPEIPTGSLGLARTVVASELRVGDVVSVTAANDTRVTHRIVAAEDQWDVVVLTLKGDTNLSPDQERYRVEEADRVFFSVPHLGRVVTVLTSRWAIFMGGLAAAALLFWAFRRRSGSDDGTDCASSQPTVSSAKSMKRRAERVKSRIGATLVAVGIPTLLVVTSGSGTAAYWTDEGTVTTTGFATHGLLQPGPITCQASGSTITVTTVSIDQRYSYWASAHTASAGGTSVGTAGYRKLSDASPRAVTFNKTDFPQIVAGTTYWLRIHSRTGAIGTTGLSGWESAEYRRQGFGWNGSNFTCGVVNPPNIVFTSPTQGANLAPSELLCERSTSGYGDSDPLACGTVTDDGNIVSLQYIFRRQKAGEQCWEDSRGWTNKCTYHPTRNVGSRWSVPGFFKNPYGSPSGYTYKLVIKAVDNQGFVTEKTISFTIR